MNAFAGKKGKNKAPFIATRHFPHGGKILELEILLLWGKYPRSGGRGSYLTIINQAGLAKPGGGEEAGLAVGWAGAEAA